MSFRITSSLEFSHEILSEISLRRPYWLFATTKMCIVTLRWCTVAYSLLFRLWYWSWRRVPILLCFWRPRSLGKTFIISPRFVTAQSYCQKYCLEFTDTRASNDIRKPTVEEQIHKCLEFQSKLLCAAKETDKSLALRKKQLQFEHSRPQILSYLISELVPFQRDLCTSMDRQNQTLSDSNVVSSRPEGVLSGYQATNWIKMDSSGSASVQNSYLSGTGRRKIAA